MLNVSISRESKFHLASATSQAVVRHTTYDDIPAWRAVRAHFPPHWQIPDDELPHEETLPWRGCSIHVDRLGSRQASARIILLHGLGTNARMMTCIGGHALNRLGYDVSALDMPYVGATKTPHNRFTYNDWIELVSDFIDTTAERDDRPVVLFGFSVGSIEIELFH